MKKNAWKIILAIAVLVCVVCLGRFGWIKYQNHKTEQARQETLKAIASTEFTGENDGDEPEKVPAGVLPHAKFHKKRTQVEELIVLDNPRLPRSFLEASRTVRRRIERAQKETGMKSFLVTSAMPGEGKSTVSANIAISLAMKEYKVILVDADLRNPSTAKVLGMQEQELGTLQVLKGEVKIEDAVQPYKDTSVMVLAGSSPIQDTSTVLSGENMRQFIKELEAKADFVVIDTPPSAMLSDAAIVAQYVDGAVFVIRQDYTEADRILEGMEILSSSGAQITGCILNDANVKGNSSQHYKNGYRLKGEVKV